MLKRIIAGFFLSIMLAAGVNADPLEDGMAAYERSDYDEALQILQPLDAQGIARAQHKLGLMYEKGKAWCRISARQ